MGAGSFPVGDTASNGQLLDFLSRLEQATTVQDVWNLTRTYTAGLGATHIGLKLDIDKEDPTFLWTVPAWTSDLYFEKVYPNHDPRLSYCRHNTTPYFHGCEFWRAKDGVPKPRRAYDETIVEVGIRSLISLPIHSVATRERSIFSYAFDVRRREFEQLYKLHGAAIHLAALAVCNRVKDLTRNRKSGCVRLTARERECLLWLGRGLHHEQIADRLKISRATVEFHVANARKRLNARTREQALAKSVQLGLIDP